MHEVRTKSKLESFSVNQRQSVGHVQEIWNGQRDQILPT